MKRKVDGGRKVSTVIVVDSENVYAFMLCFTRIDSVYISESEKKSEREVKRWGKVFRIKLKWECRYHRTVNVLCFSGSWQGINMYKGEKRHSEIEPILFAFFVRMQVTRECRSQ